jgi:hypothetical protein
MAPSSPSAARPFFREGGVQPISKRKGPRLSSQPFFHPLRAVSSILPAFGGDVCIDRRARNGCRHIRRRSQRQLAAFFARTVASAEDRGNNQSGSSEGNAQRGMKYARDKRGLARRSHRPHQLAARSRQAGAAAAIYSVRNARNGPFAYGVTPGHPTSDCQHRKDSKNYSGFLDHTLILLSSHPKTFQFYTGN